tara:strand:- start:204 stop:503 length:300 start_codon:yes stop_codon:yes gene_type:complete
MIGQCRAVRLYLRLARAAGWHHSFGDGWAWFTEAALGSVLTGSDWLAIQNAAPSLGGDGRLCRGGKELANPFPSNPDSPFMGCCSRSLLVGHLAVTTSN